MNTKAFDNLARFCYDCGKVSFAVLVIGTLASAKAFNLVELVMGVLITIMLIGVGVMLDRISEKM